MWGKDSGRGKGRRKRRTVKTKNTISDVLAILREHEIMYNILDCKRKKCIKCHITSFQTVSQNMKYQIPILNRLESILILYINTVTSVLRTRLRCPSFMMT